MAKKILIIGSSAKVECLASRLSERFEVFVASGNSGVKKFATVVDIRENNVIELLNFALENDIFFTIVCSESAIESNIAEIFDENGLLIFAPTKSAADFAINRATAKKLFYKLRLPTPRFGIYEKRNLAIDYLKKCEMPLLVKTEKRNKKNYDLVCQNYNIAKCCVEDCFANSEPRVIMEEFVYGTNFTFYVLTDGFKALPLGSVRDYRFSLDGDGGVLTEGMGACSPFTKFSFEHEDYIMNEVVYPVLNYLSEGDKPYLGILGFEGVLTPEGDIAIVEAVPFLKDHDAEAVLSLLDDDIFELMHSCTIGAFSDEYDILNIKDDFAASIVLSSGQVKNEVITGLDDVQDNIVVNHLNTKQNEYTEYETLGDRVLVLSTTARTMSRAISNLYDEADEIKFRGKYFRKDICKVPTNL
jgi:phosphoribosylamine--glycine ligase